MTDPNISFLSGRNRYIPETLLQRARDLRQRHTTAECILWECLRARRLHGFKFRRQHNIGRFIADFYCHEARLVIEVDGSVHGQQRERDAERDAWMRACGLTVLRFENGRCLRISRGCWGRLGGVWGSDGLDCGFWPTLREAAEASTSPSPFSLREKGRLGLTYVL